MGNKGEVDIILKPNIQYYTEEVCHQCHRKSGGNLVYVSYVCKIEYTERKRDDERCLPHI